MLVLSQLVFCFSLKTACAHRRYKYAVPRVRRKEEYLKQTRLAEALLNDPNCNFWSEVCRFVGHHKSVSAPVVDGVSGPENIANLWCSHFKQLHNTVDGLASTDLFSALDFGFSHDELDRTSISAEVIEVAIGKLKHGKSDGDTWMSTSASTGDCKVSSTLEAINQLITNLIQLSLVRSPSRVATQDNIIRHHSP